MRRPGEVEEGKPGVYAKTRTYFTASLPTNANPNIHVMDLQRRCQPRKAGGGRGAGVTAHALFAAQKLLGQTPHGFYHPEARSIKLRTLLTNASNPTRP